VESHWISTKIQVGGGAVRINPYPRLPFETTALVRELTDLFRQIAQQVNDFSEGSIVANYSALTSVPTTGTWNKGDVIRNTNPSELGAAPNTYIVYGWICMVAGTPGTWEELRIPTDTFGGAGGGGTVTSVAMTVPTILSVSGSPVTGSGTLAVTLATQSANLVFAGPSSGAAATPTFRSLVTDDLPRPVESMVIACSDETTALTTGTAKVTFRMPYGFNVSGVKASLTTAQVSGNIFTVDINESGASILSTKLTIDNTEKTSSTAATSAVISDSSLTDDAEMTIDIDQVGDGTAKGLKVYLVGVRA
jgi:hypothetical protein